ncbi:hypothetical protein SVAN01_09319 [Stagonosporopsis vannaccii]|nr:hypothetical protein SVAN01_09319 [Stagonosporopsis vannaccii]
MESNSPQSSPSSSTSSGLKLKLRGIQAALKEYDGFQSSDSSPHLKTSSIGKRSALQAALDDDDDDTDSEIDIMPPSRRITQPVIRKPAAKEPGVKPPTALTTPASTSRTTIRKAKKAKATHSNSDHTDDDVAFDAGDEGSSPTVSPGSNFILSSNILKRSERILDPINPEHAKLIAAAPKAGPEYYDSDADELPGNVKDTSKPHLFRNVKWGSLATDFSDLNAFSTEPEFTQFVPGRYERLPNNTASDQKRKLLIRLTDPTGRARIFTNPPPLDWSNQAAITALNKRTVQQIRRNTAVRFREVVEPYVEAERQWILAHLQEGKPKDGWRVFVQGFNAEFDGKTVQGMQGVRPKRSHSSLTKEVERFGGVYKKGEVPRVGSGKVIKAKGRKGRKGE